MNTASKGCQATGIRPPNPAIFPDSDFLPTDATEQVGLSTQKVIEEPPTTEKEQVGNFSSDSSADEENPHTCSDRGEPVTVSSPTLVLMASQLKRFNLTWMTRLLLYAP